MARPSKYKQEYADQAYKLCLLGATDKELADFFGTTEQSINAWKGKYSEFFESIKRGKDDADAKIAQSLYHRAKGYKHEAVKILQHNGEVIQVPYTEHYPPDTTACIFWLKNRQPKLWRDKQEHEVTVKGDIAERLKRARERKANGAD